MLFPFIWSSGIGKQDNQRCSSQYKSLWPLQNVIPATGYQRKPISVIT